MERVIARLGYRPSAIARSLIHQRSHTLGVVATGLDYYGPSRTLVGIEKQVRAQGYSLLLDLLHHPETEDVERILNRLLSLQVDGILWAVPEIGNNRAWLRNTNLHLQVPVVFFCQNNQWAISMPRSRQCAAATLAQKAIAYGIEGTQVVGDTGTLVISENEISGNGYGAVVLRESATVTRNRVLTNSSVGLQLGAASVRDNEATGNGPLGDIAAGSSANVSFNIVNNVSGKGVRGLYNVRADGSSVRLP